jgi:hypothetical protein
MWKKVANVTFTVVCAVVGAIGGLKTSMEIKENVADLMALCKKEDTDEPVEPAE